MIEQLRKVAEDATPGEWKHGCFAGINRRDNRVYADDRPEGTWVTVLECGDMAFEDARFIATFGPRMVKALLDVAEAAGRLEHIDDVVCGRASRGEATTRDVVDLGRARNELRSALDRLREVRS